MDDPPFHCNKSTIYVLNTNYNYGNFGGLNTDLASRPFFSYQSPDHLLPGKIGNSDNYSNSTNSSSSGNSSSNSSSCGVSALANFFPCSNAFGHGLQQQQRNKFFNFQHHHHHSQQQQQQQQQSLFRQHLLKDQPLITNTINGTAALGSNLCISPATAALLGNKKLPPIKSTIIEKKQKFWKFLEEEKWKKNSLENFSNTNCERTNSSNNVNNNDKKSEPARGHLNLHIRNDTSSSSGMDTESSSTASTTQSILLNSDNNNECNGKNSCCNYNSCNVKQTQQTQPSSSNSTMDLYREAVQLLGLSCTLCDNCRCIDCQSRYFECDDDFDCDDSLEDCFDTFGHFDGGSFNIEPEPTYDIHGLYQFNSNINNNNNNDNNNYNNNSCSNNSNNRCSGGGGCGITTRSPPDECLENNCCHYKSTSPTSSLLSSSSSSTSTLSGDAK